MDTTRRDLITAAGALALAAGARAASGAPAPAAAAAGEPPITWSLADLYPTPQAWMDDRTDVLARLPALAAYKGRLGQGPESLRAALQAISDVQRKTLRLSAYASLSADLDTSAAPAQERRQLAIALQGQLAEATAYVQPEVLAIGSDKIIAFVGADSGLAKFRFPLNDMLRKGPHTLGAEAETVLAAAGTPLAGAQQIRTQLVDSDIPWPEVMLSTGRITLNEAAYTAAREAPNRADRKLVFETFFSTFDRYKTSLASALATQVQSDVFIAKSRHYASALEAALSENGNVPTGVYRTLVEETNRGLPVLHRYFEVRRRMLGLPDMHYYDIYPPLTRMDLNFTLGRVRGLTLEAVAPLGQDYVDTLAKATSSPWADYLPRRNKVSGAYMMGDAYDVHPYLLLNLTGNYQSLSTFAHEWGHAMHTLLANKAQPFETAEYPIFTAEIASTMNEQLLAASMLAKAQTKPEKLFYLGALLELYRTTYFRQAMFAEFEMAIHHQVERGEGLSGQGMNAMYLGLLAKYHGPKVIIDPVVASEWAFVPHFYYDFYVYQYATSIAASAYFFDQVTTGGTAARDTYLGVLKAGGSDYPVEVLKKAGLDMTTPAPYRALIDRFSKTLDQVEALL